MKISKIALKNYRQYKNVELNFGNELNNGLEIFIASNGIGKSNIMNAINWCLYNREPHLDDESRALPKYNIESRKEVKDGTLDIEVEITCIMDDNSILEVRRTQEFTILSGVEPIDKPEILTVKILSKNEDTKIFENDEARTLIEKIFPEGIREYFFFDGERLEKYFSQSTGDKIEDAIANISNVSSLRTMKNRLGTIRDEKFSEVGKKSPNLTILQKEHQASIEQIIEIKNDIQKVKEQIEISNSQIDDCSEYLQGLPNVVELETNREILKNEIKSRNFSLNERIKAYRTFSREYATLIYSYNSIAKMLGMIGEKRESNELPPNISKEFIYDILSNDFCRLCNRNIALQDKIEINKMLEKIKVSTETGNKLIQYEGVLKEKIREFEKFNDNVQVYETEIGKLREEIDIREKEVKKIDDKLINFNDKEEIKKKTLLRVEAEKQKSVNTQKLGALNLQLEQTQKKNEVSKKLLEKAMEDNQDCVKLRSEIKLCENSIEYIEKIEIKIMEENRVKIESETKKNFLNLIWKKNTFGDVILDNAYNVRLIHKDGYECIGSCSAAEKALLALSFTLALHKVSGFSSPLVIDTPVSRVSDVNRENFAKVLVEVSKEKQIVLLFTPSEYSEEIKREFESNCSNKIMLSHTDNGVIEVEEVK